MKIMKFVNFDKFLLFALGLVLILHYSNAFSLKFDANLLAVLASVATLPVIWSSWLAVKNRKVSVDLLAAIALLVSLLNGQWASAVFINLMLTSARIFSDYTQEKARSAIRSLLKLRPDKVKIRRRGELIEISISEIKKGDLVVAELGDRVPVDGIVESGEATVDQSSLTGESLPIEKSTGDKILSSVLIMSGSLIIRAEKVGKDTTFEKIIRLVEDSQKNKMQIQTLVDRFTAGYIVLTILGSLCIFFFSHSLSLVLAVLLVACADDIAVAIPMAYSAAISWAGKRGIIIKGGAYLEGLNKVDTLILDKTGTITSGKLFVEEVIIFKDRPKEELLRLAGTGEYFSEHPIAKAIIKYVEDSGVEFEKSDKFEEISGRGSLVMWQDKKIICGRRNFLKENGINISEDVLKKIKIQKGQTAKSLVWIAYGEEPIGVLVLSDQIRPGVRKEILKLRNQGIRNIVMLTGDNSEVAKEVAKKVGIREFHADLLPKDKVDFVKKYLGRKGKVAMVGDGVNDAASLALSDVGIAMGAIGTDTAIESADIALMRDNFSKISEIIQLSRSVTRISIQNFWIWGIINLIGLSLVFGKIIGPEGAAAFNFVTDFLPIINSLRLFRNKLD